MSESAAQPVSPGEAGKTSTESETSGALARDPELAGLVGSGHFDQMSPEEILTWTVGKYQDRFALQCSFGNPEGLVLLDMLSRIQERPRVFVLDTGRMPQATYDLIDRVRDRYDARVDVVFPDATRVQQMVQEHGVNLFYESLEKRKLCCRIRKVEPSRRYLEGIDAYVTGLRREQNVSREATPRISADGATLKISPLIDWTHDDVWAYVRTHGVPVNRLHAEGYPTVGCEPCTRAIRAGEDPRAGRWWWEDEATKECGLHVGEEEGGSGI